MRLIDCLIGCRTAEQTKHVPPISMAPTFTPGRGAMHRQSRAGTGRGLNVLNGLPGQAHLDANHTRRLKHTHSLTNHTQKQARCVLGLQCGSGTSRNRLSVSTAAASDGKSGKPWEEKTARLVLEDGSVWPGIGFGAEGTVVAEVVFNTSLTGYQEILTDPSYKGQFVVFTQPHIGNVGINQGDMESQQCHLKGVIIRHRSEIVSNYRSVSTLDDYLKSEGVIAISGVDTRALTRILRVTGSLVGVLCTDPSVDDKELVEKAKSWSILGKDLLAEVTCDRPYIWKGETEDEWEFMSSNGSGENGAGTKSGTDKLRVVAYDYGVKTNILKRLASHGCEVTVVPADYPADKVIEMDPDGVFFSNGPGDPSAAPYAVENAKKIIGEKPTFGICMGHQIMGQAFGGSIFKLKFGHHGGNHPIKNTVTNQIEISAQNHNYAIDPASLPDSVRVTHINLNDGTCAGMVSEELNAMTIQYHPEASPGPHDADVAFEQFVTMMKLERAQKSKQAAAA